MPSKKSVHGLLRQCRRIRSGFGVCDEELRPAVLLARLTAPRFGVLANNRSVPARVRGCTPRIAAAPLGRARLTAEQKDVPRPLTRAIMVRCANSRRHKCSPPTVVFVTFVLFTHRAHIG